MKDEGLGILLRHLSEFISIKMRPWIRSAKEGDAIFTHPISYEFFNNRYEIRIEKSPLYFSFSISRYVEGYSSVIFFYDDSRIEISHLDEVLSVFESCTDKYKQGVMVNH